MSRNLPFKVRPHALRKFRLHPTFKAMERDVWVDALPSIVWYGLPEEFNYAGGIYVGCRVEAFDSQKNSLGFIPLPFRYRDHWTQLCYTIVHTRCEWDAWVSAKPSNHKIRGLDEAVIKVVAKQNSARLLHYLTIRRQIVQELLGHTMANNGVDHLDVFDEFLIRDAKGWLWHDYKKLSSNDRIWMKADPAHPDNAQYFDWRLKSHIAAELLPPKADASWVHGEITHYGFRQSWNKRLKDVVAFYRSQNLWQEVGESTFSNDSIRYPDAWHERHGPEVHFLTAEQVDVVFNRPHQRKPSSPPVVAPPSGATNPALDCPEARGILAAFADPSGGLEIPAAVGALERLFGERFDAAFWSRILDSVVRHAGEAAAMTVDEAWGTVTAAAGASSSTQQAVGASPSDQLALGARDGGHEVSDSAAGGMGHEASMEAFLAQQAQML